MNEGLSRLVAGLVAQAKRGEDLSPGIDRVRTLIKKVIEGDTTIFGKLHALVESFREVIPEEKQRYQAAVTALSATSKLDREEIVVGVDNQLEQLRILEKLLIAAIPRRPEELKAMEARSKKMRSEIAGLREKIARLEKEEKEIADSMAGREKETAVIEEAVRGVFADIGAEITSLREKLAELPESAAQQPVPDTGSNADAAGEKQSGLRKNEVHGRSPGADSIFPEQTPDPDRKKKCGMCGGRMDYYIAERKWQCFSCAYEEPEQGEVQGRDLNRELTTDAIFPEPAPVPRQKQTGDKAGQTTAPEPAPGSGLKQKCPMCGGQMDYYIADRKWQCYSCGFENNEYNKDAGKGGTEEKADRSNALLAILPAEPLFDNSSTTPPSPGYWPQKKESSPVKKLPPKSKTCPGCGRKMHWYGPGRGWQCGHCGYQRRI